MPARSQSSKVHTPNTAELAVAAYKHILKQFPDHSASITRIIKRTFAHNSYPGDMKVTASQSKPVKPKHVVDQNEVVAVFQKLQQLSQLPGTTFDPETQLYLEQQLADILGFEVSSEMEGVSLSFTKGSATSLPHLLHSPTTTLSSVTLLPEAGLAKTRSDYGWQLSSLIATTDQPTETQYWVSFSTKSFIAQEHTSYTLKKWMYKKKVLVINPQDALCCVAQIRDEYIDTSSRYQLGISPALARHISLWSPQNLGKVIVFFIPDVNNQISTGVYQLIN